MSCTFLDVCPKTFELNNEVIHIFLDAEDTIRPFDSGVLDQGYTYRLQANSLTLLSTIYRLTVPYSKHRFLGMNFSLNLYQICVQFPKLVRTCCAMYVYTLHWYKLGLCVRNMHKFQISVLPNLVAELFLTLINAGKLA